MISYPIEKYRRKSNSCFRTMSFSKQILYGLCGLFQFSLVQFLSHVLLFETPWTSAHKPPCPSPTHRVNSNSCPLSQQCNPTISPSVVPFSSRPQSFLASGYFPMSQLFTLGGRSIGVSASASVLPMNTQDWSPLGWTGWTSLQSKRVSTPQFKSVNSLVLSFLHSPTLTSIHDYWKNHSFEYMDYCW